MELDQYIFKRKPDEYTRSMDPIKEYMKQAVTYLCKRKKVTKEEANELIKLKIKETKLVNPIVRFNHQQPNSDFLEETVKLTDYLKDIKDNNEVVAPSFTTYKQPKDEPSVHSDFLKFNVGRRKENKTLAFKYKQDNMKEKEIFHTTLQMVMKTFNNAMSGGYASKSTVLYNPSAHATLTSTTRCLSSIGNAISESVITGNKHFRNPEIVYNYITAIISNCKKDLIESTLSLYKLTTPTVDNVMDMIVENIKYYWRSEIIEADIKDYLSCLEGYELAAILYTNDMHNVRLLNDNFCRVMIDQLIESKTDITEDPVYLTKSAEGVEILSKIINSELIKGMNIDYKELKGTELMSTLASTAKNICDVLMKYKMFFRCFFTSDILPISIAYIKDMLRKCIVLSDTDSTCGAYQEWVNWYFGKIDFSSKAISVASAIMTIVTQSMDHNIKVFTKNMNIDPDRVETLKMKNEFYWNVFVPTNVSKHYFANTCIQEGNVYREPDLELKGVHLIGSAVDQSYVKEIHKMIKDINLKLSTEGKISIYPYIEKIANMEKSIIEKIKSGSIDVYSKTNIKDPSSYKQSEEESAYWHHLLWENVFSAKYGSPGKPPYMVAKIPLTIDSNKKLTDFLSSIKDDGIKFKLAAFLLKSDKKSLGTFRPPVLIAAAKGIPEEFTPYIDINRVVQDNLKSGYMVLEALGFYKKDDRLIIDMGY